MDNIIKIIVSFIDGLFLGLLSYLLIVLLYVYYRDET